MDFLADLRTKRDQLIFDDWMGDRYGILVRPDSSLPDWGARLESHGVAVGVEAHRSLLEYQEFIRKGRCSISDAELN